MSTAYYVCVLALLAVDVLAIPWASWRARAAQHASYLLLPYGALLLVPLIPAGWISAVAAVIAVGALVSFSNMVGLTSEWRFFVPTVVATPAFFVAAHLRWYGLFQAMPVFAVFFILALGATLADSRAFLQKLCLSWLSVLVYGYLWAHAAVFVETDFGALPDGKRWVLYLLLLAKAGDVAWVLVQRLRSPSDTWQLLVTPLGSAAGGALVGWLAGPASLGLLHAAALGAVVGAALAIASRAYGLIVADVLELKRDTPLKGKMLFGFSFSLALGYHYARYLS